MRHQQHLPPFRCLSILPTAPCSRYGRPSSSTIIARLRPLPVLEEAGRDGVTWERVTRPVGVLLVCWRFIVMKRPSGFLGVLSFSSLEEASYA